MVLTYQFAARLQNKKKKKKGLGETATLHNTGACLVEHAYQNADQRDMQKGQARERHRWGPTITN